LAFPLWLAGQAGICWGKILLRKCGIL